jgi:hypothetical protein
MGPSYSSYTPSFHNPRRKVWSRSIIHFPSCALRTPRKSLLWELLSMAVPVAGNKVCNIHPRCSRYSIAALRVVNSFWIFLIKRMWSIHIGHCPSGKSRHEKISWWVGPSAIQFQNRRSEFGRRTDVPGLGSPITREGVGAKCAARR